MLDHITVRPTNIDETETMTCKYCGETIDPDEPDVRYRPGDGENRLDFHLPCYSEFSLDATFWATKEFRGWEQSLMWEHWKENQDEYPKERP